MSGTPSSCIFCQPPPQVQEQGEPRTFWEKARSYQSQPIAEHLQDLATIAEDVLNMGSEEARLWAQARVSKDNLPTQADGICFKSNALMWDCGRAGHWRGEPDNSGVRKLAKSIALGRFRPAWHSELHCALVF